MRESPSVRAVSQVSVKHVPRLPRWLFPQRALFSLSILPIEEAPCPCSKDVTIDRKTLPAGYTTLMFVLLIEKQHYVVRFDKG